MYILILYGEKTAEAELETGEADARAASRIQQATHWDISTFPAGRRACYQACRGRLSAPASRPRPRPRQFRRRGFRPLKSLMRFPAYARRERFLPIRTTGIRYHTVLQRPPRKPVRIPGVRRLSPSHQKISAAFDVQTASRRAVSGQPRRIFSISSAGMGLK